MISCYTQGPKAHPSIAIRLFLVWVKKYWVWPVSHFTLWYKLLIWAERSLSFIPVFTFILFWTFTYFPFLKQPSCTSVAMDDKRNYQELPSVPLCHNKYCFEIITSHSTRSLLVSIYRISYSRCTTITAKHSQNCLNIASGKLNPYSFASVFWKHKTQFAGGVFGVLCSEGKDLFVIVDCLFRNVYKGIWTRLNVTAFTQAKVPTVDFMKPSLLLEIGNFKSWWLVVALRQTQIKWIPIAMWLWTSTVEDRNFNAKYLLFIPKSDISIGK